MFIPWRGEFYGNHNNILNGMRLIVLGESHYVNGVPIGAPMPDLTQEVVDGYIDGRHSYRFFTRIMNIVLGRGESSLERRSAFWNSVVFFNYIPVIAANKKGQRPPKELWLGDAPAYFLANVRHYEAEAVLVCGTELWRKLPPALPKQYRYPAAGRDWDGKDFEVALPYRAIAAHIPHPTGSRLASDERCTPVVEFLRSRVNTMRLENKQEPIMQPTRGGI